ncbi:MAG TPA: hypothetical protein VFI91_11900 [Longimicrobiaceae bacterium]|nr:hypothetical protein [Longimicrobiaceae bacterium]
MTGTLRFVLWVLGGLAILWLLFGLAMLLGMGSMMNGEMSQGGMAGGDMMGGCMMMGNAMMGMMGLMAAQVIAMAGLAGIFIYLVVDSVRNRRQR